MNLRLQGVMYRGCSLRLGTDIGVRPAADKKFRLRLTVNKMHTFAVFTKRYLRPYGNSGTNFMAAVKWANPNTETKNKIIDTEIIEMQS